MMTPDVRAMDELRVSSEALLRRSRAAMAMATESREHARALRERSDRLHVLHDAPREDLFAQWQENA
ncbi:MAG: hypothetical protein AB3N17_17075 [Tateyamaria sp.]